MGAGVIGGRTDSELTCRSQGMEGTLGVPDTSGATGRPWRTVGSADGAGLVAVKAPSDPVGLPGLGSFGVRLRAGLHGWQFPLISGLGLSMN